MAYQLADLLDEIQESIPPVNSRPTDRQYDLAVRSAVDRLSNDLGMTKQGTLSVVSGTSAYTLPADFIKLIKIDDLSRGLAYDTDGKIIPLNTVRTVGERIFVNGQTLTIDPEPGYTLDRKYSYKAAHVLDANDVYQDMSQADAELVLILAQIHILRNVQLGTTAQDGFRYQFGDVMVDRGNQTKSIGAGIETLEKQYKSRLERQMKPVGQVVRHDLTDLARWESRKI